MINIVKSVIAKSVLGKIAGDNDLKATVIGAIAAGLQATQIDWGKLLNGDPNEIGKLAGVITTAVLGYYINKPSKPSTPSPKPA